MPQTAACICVLMLQMVIQVCTDLTLCMLSLMMSETPTAMGHLLHAISSLHEAGHTHIMQGLLRLFLPQGNYSNSCHGNQPPHQQQSQHKLTAFVLVSSCTTYTTPVTFLSLKEIKIFTTIIKEQNMSWYSFGTFSANENHLQREQVEARIFKLFSFASYQDKRRNDILICFCLTGREAHEGHNILLTCFLL